MRPKLFADFGRGLPSRLLALRFLILAAPVIFLLSSCNKSSLPKGCEPPDFQCYENHALEFTTEILKNVAIWTKIAQFGQAAIIFCGVVAAVMIALQNEGNQKWTKPIGLLASALVTGITSFLITFHVSDNLQSQIDIAGKIADMTDEFDNQIMRLTSGKSESQIREDFIRNPSFRADAVRYTSNFATNFNAIKRELLAVDISTVKLNGPNAASTAALLDRTESAVHAASSPPPLSPASQ
jgi:hypothetical protein